jgi:DNA-binding MarR family transcriptional regulator
MPDSDRIDEVVAQWGRERPDIDTRAMALIGRIQRAAAALRPRLDEVHAKHGLTGESFDVLAALRRSGPPYTLTPTGLYRQLMLSSGAVTNRVDHLEAQGLIAREPDDVDRRSIRVRLTAKGKQLIDRAVAAHALNETRILGALTAAERDQVSALLRKALLAWEPE